MSLANTPELIPEQARRHESHIRAGRAMLILAALMTLGNWAAPESAMDPDTPIHWAILLLINNWFAFVALLAGIYALRIKVDTRSILLTVLASMLIGCNIGIQFIRHADVTG